MNNDALFTPWPEAFVQRYKDQGFWCGQTLCQVLKDQATLRGDKVALIDGGRSVSYKMLSHKMESLAYGFWDLGLRSGDRAVLHMPNCIDFFETLFALMRIGVIPVLALPLHRESEIEYFCQHTQAKAYITKTGKAPCTFESIAQYVKRSALTDFVITAGDFSSVALSLESLALRVNEDFQPAPVRSEQVALFQLSGGTTGTPKLIPRTHDDYFYSVRESVNVCALSSQTIFLAALPVAHNFILSSPGSLGVLYSGGTVIMTGNPSPAAAFELIQKHRITITALVPPLALAWVNAYENLQQRNEACDISSLSLIQVGGAKLSASVAQKIRPTLGCQLQQVFGMAEGLVNYTRLNDTREMIEQTQGRPMSSADEIIIADDHDQPLPLGASGHLLTRGPYTIRGYFRAPEHNINAFTSDGFFRTGDIAMQLESGHIVVTGRSKDQINRGGEKISAEELEDHCLAHCRVLDVAVVALPDPYLGERVCAVVVLKEETAGSCGHAFKRDLLGHLRTRKIADYKIPDRIELMNHLPKTKFGKVDKQALRARFSQSPLLQKNKINTPTEAIST